MRFYPGLAQPERARKGRESLVNVYFGLYFLVDFYVFHSGAQYCSALSNHKPPRQICPDKVTS